MANRYIVFAYSMYYPMGGENDIVSVHAGIEEVESYSAPNFDNLWTKNAETGA